MAKKGKRRAVRMRAVRSSARSNTRRSQRTLVILGITLFALGIFVSSLHVPDSSLSGMAISRAQRGVNLNPNSGSNTETAPNTGTYQAEDCSTKRAGGKYVASAQVTVKGKTIMNLKNNEATEIDGTLCKKSTSLLGFAKSCIGLIDPIRAETFCVEKNSNKKFYCTFYTKNDKDGKPTTTFCGPISITKSYLA